MDHNPLASNFFKTPEPTKCNKKWTSGKSRHSDYDLGISPIKSVKPSGVRLEIPGLQILEGSERSSRLDSGRPSFVDRVDSDLVPKKEIHITKCSRRKKTPDCIKSSSTTFKALNLQTGAQVPFQKFTDGFSFKVKEKMIPSGGKYKLTKKMRMKTLPFKSKLPNYPNFKLQPKFNVINEKVNSNLSKTYVEDLLKFYEILKSVQKEKITKTFSVMKEPLRSEIIEFSAKNNRLLYSAAKKTLEDYSKEISRQIDLMNDLSLNSKQPLNPKKNQIFRKLLQKDLKMTKTIIKRCITDQIALKIGKIQKNVSKTLQSTSKNIKNVKNKPETEQKSAKNNKMDLEIKNTCRSQLFQEGEKTIKAQKVEIERLNTEIAKQLTKMARLRHLKPPSSYNFSKNQSKKAPHIPLCRKHRFVTNFKELHDIRKGRKVQALKLNERKLKMTPLVPAGARDGAKTRHSLKRPCGSISPCVEEDGKDTVHRHGSKPRDPLEALPASEKENLREDSPNSQKALKTEKLVETAINSAKKIKKTPKRRKEFKTPPIKRLIRGLKPPPTPSGERKNKKPLEGTGRGLSREGRL